jgi:hypothetical protein
MHPWPCCYTLPVAGRRADEIQVTLGYPKVVQFSLDLGSVYHSAPAQFASKKLQATCVR